MSSNEQQIDHPSINQTDIPFQNSSSSQSAIKLKNIQPFDKDLKPYRIHHHQKNQSNSSHYKLKHLYKIVNPNKASPSQTSIQLYQDSGSRILFQHNIDTQKNSVNKNIPQKDLNILNYQNIRGHDSFSTYQFKDILKKTYRPQFEEKQKKKEQDQQRVTEFMMRKFTDKIQENLEISKKDQTKTKMIDIKRAQGFFSPSKFVQPNRNVLLLNHKSAHKPLISTISYRPQTTKNMLSTVHQEKYQQIQSIEGPIIVEEQTQSQKLITPMSRLSKVRYEHTFKTPQIQGLVSSFNDNKNPYMMSNFSQKTESLKEMQITGKKQKSRNRIIDINDAQMAITQNTFSTSKKSSVDQGKIERILSATTNNSKKASQWSLIDHMYQGVVTSPMNQQERIKAISQMSKHQFSSEKQMKFNKTSKIQLKFLASQKESKLFENAFDEGNGLVNTQKSDFKEVSQALCNYMQATQNITRPNTQQQNQDLYSSQKDQDFGSHAKNFNEPKSKRAQTANSTKLQGLLRSSQTKFFDENFALKDQESENLKIEYLLLQKEAKELNRKQAQTEILDQSKFQKSQPSNKAKKLISLICQY
eukprot:403360885